MEVLKMRWHRERARVERVRRARIMTAAGVVALIVIFFLTV
jgi:hypothetical protein